MPGFAFQETNFFQGQLRKLLRRYNQLKICKPQPLAKGIAQNTKPETLVSIANINI